MLDELKQAKAFSRVFDGAPIGICVIELDGRLLDANSTLRKMLGFEDLEERVITTDLTDPRDVSRSTELFVDLAAGCCESFSLDKRYVRADGGTAHAHSTALLVRDVVDEPDFVLGLIEPRDELVHLRGEISEAQTAAHDINNLLTAIFGYQELLVRALPPDDKRRRAAEEIGNAARMSAPIVQNILRTGPRHAEPVDVNELILGMQSIAAQLVGSNVTIVLRLDPTISPVFVERERLERSIANIAVNARDAMPDGGTLVIETTSDAASVKILISDTGVGVEPGLRSRIFDRDFSTKPHGKGIGLALARDTVRGAGGFIRVDSYPGQGATFTLAFPRRAATPIEDSTDGGEW
jgi:PAS domain S-box-containing protein